VAQSFFEPDGDRFVATELTRGPWNATHQHGGPPSALLARALERTLAASAPLPMQIVRITVEFLRPILLAPVTLATEMERAGKKVARLSGTASIEGTPVCRATALAIRTSATDLPQLPAPLPITPPLPAQSRPYEFSFFRESVGYQTGMETRFARGEWGRGPTTVWMRMRVPLVPGESPSPLQRVVIAADSGNGVSPVLDPGAWTFVNPDLTVYLHRAPEGEWICIDAVTIPSATGVGLAESALFDERGPIGRSAQSLVIEKRQA
jgi:hypothetical protein